MANKKGAEKIAEWKIKEVNEIVKTIKQWPVIGLLNMESLPALQLLRMKHNLHDSVKIRMVRKESLIRALDKLGSDLKNGDQIKERIRGMPALIFTKESPFKLYKILKKSKSKAPAKAGQVAPNDLIIKAGPTSFDPGPIIGELGRVGLKTKVEGGKIHIANDKVLVKEGEVINEGAADVLAKLGIEPMEIGLNLILAYENGEILGKDVLDVDEAVYLQNIQNAYSRAFSLAIGVGYVMPENVIILLSKGRREALALVDEADILTNENVGNVLAKAEKAASVLKSKVPDAPVEEKKKEGEKMEELNIEEAKEEPVAEEVKSEEPKEEPIAEEPIEEATEEEASNKEEFAEEEKKAQNFIQQATDKIIKGK